MNLSGFAALVPRGQRLVKASSEFLLPLRTANAISSFEVPGGTSTNICAAATASGKYSTTGLSAILRRAATVVELKIVRKDDERRAFTFAPGIFTGRIQRRPCRSARRVLAGVLFTLPPEPGIRLVDQEYLGRLVNRSLKSTTILAFSGDQSCRQAGGSDIIRHQSRDQTVQLC